MLAIFIFSIAAVSASDVNDTVIASEDTGQMKLSAGDEITEDNIQTNENILTQASTDETVNASNEQDVLSSFGTYADLDYEINNGGTTVELQRDYYAYDGTPVSIGITEDNKIIDGKGAVIDMAGAPSSIRIFDIDASGVTIKNLTIINVNFFAYGGAILFESGSNGTVENCNFINNTASDGSAICFMGSTGTVRNCNFTNNSCESYGGAIAFSYFGSTGTVTDCNFAYNSAKYGGAIAFAYDSTGTVTNCNFTNNNTADYGGAVYFSSSGNVTNCNFVNGSSYYGGAVFWIGNDGRISDCNFTGNTAVRRGGAVHWGDTETESESQSDYTKAKNGIITRSNFINNTAAQGGAVFWFANDGKITDNCYFKDNNATGEGGAVYWKGKNGYISNKCTFTDNEAIIYAGAIYWQGDDGTLTDNCRFIKNSAYTQGADGIYRGGGAIFWMGRNANVSDNCSFINNTADTSEGSGFLDSYRGGGAIYIPGAESHVTDCIFTGNFATHYGGAVYAVGGNSVVDRCSFENNSANMGGAAFTAASDYSYISNCVFVNNYGIDFSSNGGAVNFKNYENSLSNCTFKDNYAENCGGAVYWQRDGGDVFNCSFENNSAYTSGGALYMEYGGTISYCDFVNNYVTGWASTAGAVYIYSASSIKNCNFTDNKATGDDSCGGAVYFFRNSEGNVTNCSFANNSAVKNGGAIYFDEGSNGRTINCNFTNNSARYGGAIRFSSTGNVTNCNFTNNSASDWGGAIYMYSGNVENCNFVDNKATSYDGGAIYFSSSGTVENCNFTNNTATNGDGGAIWMYSGSVENCNFTNNSASEDGGAVYFWSNGEVRNCNFTNNTASVGGGAIYFENSGNVTNCNFTNNKATGSNSWGGAILFASTGNVTNCNFTDNIANRYGGAVYFSGTGEVTNCNFTNNSASNRGGAVYFYGNGDVTNCNFTGNNATTGSAIYFYSTSATKTVSNSRFLNNRANAEALEVTKNDNNITITFTGKDNLLNAIYSRNDAEVTFTNVTYWSANGIATTGSSAIKPSRSNKEAGQNITVGVVVNGELVLSGVYLTDENGMIVLDISAGENYYISVRHDTDSYYTEAEKTISNNTKFSVNVTSQTTNNKTVNITAKSNIPDEVINGKLLFIVPNSDSINATYAGNGTWWTVYTFGDYGDYQVNATYSGLDNVTVNNATISISKTPTEITLVNETVNLFVEDSISSGATLTPAVGNLTYTSNNESVAKVKDCYIIAVGEGTALITVSFAGSDDYAPAMNKTINVTVSKIPTNISVVPVSLDLFVGDETVIVATLTPGDAGNVTFKSSDEDLVLVEDDGNVIANGKGQAIITVSFSGNDKYAAVNKTINVTVKLNNANVTVDKDTLDLKVDETYQINATKNPDTILLDITYTSNNTSVASVDKNGIVRAVGEGTAIITLSVGDDEIYAKNSTNITVTVKKSTPKLTANAKTFKNTDKTKKYTVTLKNSKGKPIANAQVSLKVNGKTYTAKTNSKGQATFKLTKLTKTGTYTATVKYAGDKKHAAVSAKAKITVKSTWKTIAKGSNYHSMVKKIQIALKNKGYYQTYNGHYLKVDGIFNTYTEMAVMQFQKASGLKVTGKVDYNTAKKLGITK